MTWTGDISGHGWTRNDDIEADRLTDAVVIDGETFSVGSYERGGRLTSVLLPL